ncbi:uncharacterized protein LOC131006815 isoform X2 [Salvia miltiorrhiza]|uniref:uncharacterized protein LOC131006815 isoform X2 n=1 Tax=Salvia miltiorrhiza TaxID=226208 RepID=UPI0025AC1B0A|nr:uncharacterized protein LOC131006815 isoform X2 [Salvia miltiorrhiza]
MGSDGGGWRGVGRRWVAAAAGQIQCRSGWAVRSKQIRSNSISISVSLSLPRSKQIRADHFSFFLKLRSNWMFYIQFHRILIPQIHCGGASQYGGLSKAGEEGFTSADAAIEETIKPTSKHTIEVPIAKRLREVKTQAVDYLILLIVGASLGSLIKANDETFGFSAYTYTIIAVFQLLMYQERD